MFLAFVFSLVLKGVEPRTQAAIAKAQEMKTLSQGSVGVTMKAILEMFEAGKLD